MPPPNSRPSACSAAAPDKVLAGARRLRRGRRSARIAPFSAGSVKGVAGSWLLESDRRALAVVARADAACLWRALEDAGRPFGISCVGYEAARRYALLERSAAG